MNFTIHQLRVFVKVAELESVTQAAEHLHLTQPAVSIQLKNFQEQFDVPLTEVVGRKLYVTAFGKEILESAYRILAELDAIKDQTNRYKGLLSGKLVVSSVSTGKYVAPYFLTDFVRAHEGVDLVLDVTNKSTVLEHLRINEIDFALMSVLPQHLDVEYIDLVKNKLFLVASGQLKFPKKKYKSEELKDFPLIFREEGSGTRTVMENYLSTHAISYTKKMELTSNEAVKQAVIAGLGLSIMPLIGIKNELLNGDLQIVPVQQFPIETSWYLVWLRQKNLSPVAREFLKFIADKKEEIVQKEFAWINRV
jgi:LysR family transcriptional regulator, low CO2-responsive transcriptional regulator